MKKKVFRSSLISLILILLVFSTVFAAGATRGEGVDPGHLEFGTIKYVFNKAGYQFWFTVGDSVHGYHGLYEKGHDYHINYKLKVDDPNEWCSGTSRNYGPEIPNRHLGKKIYYKVFDKTTGEIVCP